MQLPSNFQPSHSQITGPQGSDPGQRAKHQHRLGVVPVGVGVDIPHRLKTIDLPLNPPDHSTRTTRRARSVLDKDKFIWGTNDLDVPIGAPPGTKGSPCPVAVKRGNMVTQATVDGTRKAFTKSEAAKHLQVACQHPACAGKRWKSVQELIEDHPSDEECQKEGQVHVYYGVCEVPAVKAKPESGEESEGATLVLVAL